jgi:hypothetical protein
MAWNGGLEIIAEIHIRAYVSASRENRFFPSWPTAVLAAAHGSASSSATQSDENTFLLKGLF